MKVKKMATRYAVIGAVGLLCGCAATSANRASSGHPLTLMVQVEATERSQAGSRPIAPNETLHSGDTLSLRAKVDQPAYVYAVWYSEKGWSKVLSPPGGMPLVQPGFIVKMPDEDVEAKLDDVAGDEQLIVVALPHPIDDPTCALLRMRCPSRTEQTRTRGGDLPPPPPPPSPPPSSPPPTPPGVPAKERNGQLVLDAEPHQVQVQSDAAGIALLRFPFKHTP